MRLISCRVLGHDKMQGLWMRHIACSEKSDSARDFILPFRFAWPRQADQLCLTLLEYLLRLATVIVRSPKWRGWFGGGHESLSRPGCGTFAVTGTAERGHDLCSNTHAGTSRGPSTLWKNHVVATHCANTIFPGGVPECGGSGFTQALQTLDRTWFGNFNFAVPHTPSAAALGGFGLKQTLGELE